MSGASRAGSGHRGSWRAGPARRPSAHGAPWAQRILFSLLGLVLVGLFAWLIIWWIFLPTVHFAYLPVVDYDALAAPPLRFVEEDAQGFAAAAPHGPAAPLRDLQTSEAMPTLGKRLQGLLTGRKDTLVLYVAAHGVSVDGKPYLLSSDWRRGAQSGRYALADFLAQLRDCPADLKLLLLDAGRVDYDPPSGVLVNQFPRLVRQELAQIDDPALWLLLSHHPLETARASDSARRSAFGYWVSEGLRGGADRNTDRKVDLAELADFVRGGVCAWALRETAGQAAQTPWLLRGGGDVTAPPPIALVPVGCRAQAGAEPAEAPSGEEAGPKAEKAPDPKAARAEHAAELRRLLDEAWAARDTLADRTDVAPWSPVDYAPHLWREFEALLLGYEDRLAGGAAYDPQRLAQALRTELALLPAWLEGRPMPAGADRSTILGRLAEARETFLGGPAAASYGRSSAAADAVRAAVQAQNDLAFRAVDCVRWHGRAARDSSQQLAAYPALRELVTTALPALAEALASLGEEHPSRPRTRAEMQTRLDALQEAVETAVRLRARIEAEGLRREAGELVREAKADARKKGVADRMDALLAVPLLPARLRADLAGARAGLDQAMETPPGPSAPAAPPEITLARRERTAEQAELEVALVALAGPERAAGLAPGAAQLARLAGAAGDWDEGAWWSELDRLGSGLGEFYQGLPARIDEAARGTDPAVLRSAALWLRLVDARDARRVGPDAVLMAVPPVPAPPPPEPALAVSRPDTARLDRRAWTPVEWAVVADGPAAGPAEVSLDFDPSLLEVETGEGNRPVAPRQTARLTLVPGEAQAVVYRVRSKSAQTEETTLSVTVSGGGRTASHTVRLRVPPPDVVDLLVRGPGATVDRRPGEANRIRLQPFPNRTTEYRFELANRSGKDRKVRVQLWGLPPGAAAAQTDEAPTDEAGNPRLGFVRLHEPVEVPLGGGAAVPIPFPAPPEKPAPKDAPAGEKPEQPPPAPDLRPAVTGGMAATVTDVDDPGRRFLTRIEIAPLAPKVYLDPVVSYDPAQQRLTVHLKARDSDGDGRPNPELLPLTTPESPVRVAWDTAGVLDPGTEMKDRAELVPPQFESPLFAKVEQAAGKVVPVRLSVDGYPRAFVYQVRCDRARSSVERERSLCEVRFVRPADGDAFLAPADSVPVELQVDAPEDAFQRPGDVVEVGIDEDGDNQLRHENKLTLSTDRQVSARLEALGPQGTVRLSAEVGDFRVAIPASGLRNKKVRVMAKLSVAGLASGAERAVAEDSVEIVLDGAPPDLRIEAPAKPVAAGQDVPFSARAEDLGGVARIEVGLDLDGSGELDAPDKPKTLLGPAPDGTWSAAIEGKELAPGRYELIARATDRVGLVTTGRKVVTVLPPSGMAEKPAPKTGTIQGRVLLVDRPISGIAVTIEGLNRKTTTDENGRFLFRDVPHGSHKLLAKGAALNKFREGSAAVTLPGATDPLVADIFLQ